MIHTSAKTDYACLAMLDLALGHADREPTQLRRIAEAHGIPSRFLVQILLQLKKAGLVQTTRGSTGGYRLARDPQQISVWDVVRVMEGSWEDRAISGRGPGVDVIRDVWHRAAERSRELLQRTTLAKLADRMQRESHEMYHI